MTFEELIEKAKKYDNEDIKFELKESRKFIENNKIDVDELIKLMVGMGNRFGGSIVIGIKDNGDAEGLDIFEKFSDGYKSGIDKFKEVINNKVLDSVSPPMNYTTNYYINEEYEILVINVMRFISIPFAIVRRSNHRILERKYYIKTIHNVTTVSDEQLAWLFNPKFNESETVRCYFDFTFFKDITGIPVSIGKYGDRFIVQNSIVHKWIDDIFYKIPSTDISKIVTEENKNRFVTELIFICVAFSIFGRFTPSTIIKDLNLGEGSLIKNFFNEESIISNSYFHPIIDFKNIKIDLSSTNEYPFCELKFDSPYYSLKLIIQNISWKVGISNFSPNYDVLLNYVGGKGLSIVDNEYETFGFEINLDIIRHFPEIIDDKFLQTNEFIKQILRNFNAYWDTKTYIENLPHYEKIYSIEFLLEEIYKKIYNDV